MLSGYDCPHVTNNDTEALRDYINYPASKGASEA